MEHAAIYVEGGSDTINDIATGTLWTTVTNFDTAGPYNKIQPNVTTDNKLEILKDNIYYAFCHIDFIGPENTRTEFAILKNGVASDIRAGRSIGATGTYDTLAFGGTLQVVAGDDITLGVQAPITGTWMTVQNAWLVAFRLDNQG